MFQYYLCHLLGLGCTQGMIPCAFPVGPPDAGGYYDAQPFGTNTHLGSDWNGNGGGNTDLGDPVSAIADGTVTEAQDYEGGWGLVARVVHTLDNGQQVESLYAHLDSFEVTKGQHVEKGEQIGTIGTAHGHYPAHLHLEVRTAVGADIGTGYGEPDQGQIDPSAFIRMRR